LKDPKIDKAIYLLELHNIYRIFCADIIDWLIKISFNSKFDYSVTKFYVVYFIKILSDTVSCGQFHHELNIGVDELSCDLIFPIVIKIKL